MKRENRIPDPVDPPDDISIWSLPINTRACNAVVGVLGYQNATLGAMLAARQRPSWRARLLAQPNIGPTSVDQLETYLTSVVQRRARDAATRHLAALHPAAPEGQP